jgi:hypothetical protein
MIRIICWGTVAGLTLATWAREEPGEITLQAYIKASNSAAYDRFGEAGALALAGDTLVVGAPGEDSSAKGVNGDQGDGLDPTPQNRQEGFESGAAYVFLRYGAGWSQQAYLKSTDTAERDQFGKSVAISGDTVAVSAPGADGKEGGRSFRGAVYIFVRKAGTWQQQARLTVPAGPGVDHFGGSVAICGDTLVVGAHGESSMPAAGKADDEGELMAGAAYVFVREGGEWKQQARLEASNARYKGHFGTSVGISGNTVIVGAIGDASAAGGVNGNQNDNARNNAGAAYVFVRDGAEWKQQAYLKAAKPGDFDEFGSSVAVAGDTAVVGAAGARTKVQKDGDDGPGAAFVFVRDGRTWTAQAALTLPESAGREEFGAAVGVSGERVVIGAPRARDTPGKRGESTGAAYVFVRNAGGWDRGTRLMASGARNGDQFGGAVAISGTTAAVGAAGEPGFARGVNGDRGNSSSGNHESGAAYVFVNPGAESDKVAPAGAGEGKGRLEEAMFGYWGVDTEAMAETLRAYAGSMLDMKGIRPGHKDRVAAEKEEFAKIKAEFESVAMVIQRGEIVDYIYPGRPEKKTYRVLSMDEATGTLALEVSRPDSKPYGLRITLRGNQLTIAGDEDEGRMIFQRIDEAGFKSRLKAAEKAR